MDLKTSWSLITRLKNSNLRDSVSPAAVQPAASTGRKKKRRNLQDRKYIEGIRLENATWRKWFQTKFNLKKIRPDSEFVRWKKDEDITWLYGPFVTAEQPVHEHITTLSIVDPMAKKSALKKGGERALVTELKKFQVDNDVKVGRKFPRLSSETSQTVQLDSVHQQIMLKAISDGDINSRLACTQLMINTHQECNVKSRLRFKSEVEVVEFSDVPSLPVVPAQPLKSAMKPTVAVSEVETDLHPTEQVDIKIDEQNDGIVGSIVSLASWAASLVFGQPSP